MIKHFILDTNVFLHNPSALFLFEDNCIVIPISVIEEIDRFKKDMSEIGRNARLTSRYLDQLRDQGNLAEGVKLDSGGTVRVDVSRHRDVYIDDVLLENNADNQILLVALSVKEEHPNEPTILVTKDTNLRIKADSLGLKAQDFENAKVDINDLYTGLAQVEVDGATIDRLYENHEVEIEGDFFANQFLHLLDPLDPQHNALARYRAKNKHATLLKTLKNPVCNIMPRNREQRFALDLLLDDKINLVTLVGKAGTGKTLLALAAGLQKVLNNDNGYNRLIVSRPIYPMGRELGFLPGDLDTKLKPWMQPIFDNLMLLLSSPVDKAAQYTRLNDYLDNEIIELEALTYIRGRSLPNVYLLVDEAQNLTPHELKTTVTRAGEGTKIVLTGDPYQIDNPYLDSNSNGLTYIVERMKGQEISGHMTLIKGERSPLAELAANIL